MCARPASMIAIAALLGGCGGTALLTGPHPQGQRHQPHPPAPSSSGYLSQLGGEQQKLAVAERSLPRRARTPAELSKAISLLESAIRRLASDLATLRPPASVSGLHTHLVAIVRTYAVGLAAAARDARRPGGVSRAATELLSTTSDASRAFSATITKIDQLLMR